MATNEQKVKAKQKKFFSDLKWLTCLELFIHC